MQNSNNPRKYALIAGNAPSLAKIDYSRLGVYKNSVCDNQTNPTKNPPPRFEISDSFKLSDNTTNKDFFQDFAIFRANQFYFEPKYYLGKRVDYAFLTPNYMLENHFTHSFLKFNSEYEIGRTIAVTLGFESADRFYNDHKHCFAYILDGKEFLQKLEAFFAFMQFNELHYNARPTSGIYMCAVAIALGFREIFIAGIDLYQSATNYAFDEKTPNILLKDPNFGAVGDMHSLKMDIESLEFLGRHYGAKFYSICPNSPLSQYIPLADSANLNFIAESKSNNYTKDILIPNKCAYEKLACERDCKSWGYSSPYDEIAKADIERTKHNSALKALKDIIRFPRDLWNYVRLKNAKKANKSNGGGELQVRDSNPFKWEEKCPHEP